MKGEWTILPKTLNSITFQQFLKKFFSVKIKSLNRPFQVIMTKLMVHENFTDFYNITRKIVRKIVPSYPLHSTPKKTKVD